jgi:hypothetical protein
VEIINIEHPGFHPFGAINQVNIRLGYRGSYRAHFDLSSARLLFRADDDLCDGEVPPDSLPDHRHERPRGVFLLSYEHGNMKDIAASVLSRADKQGPMYRRLGEFDVQMKPREQPT